MREFLRATALAALLATIFPNVATAQTTCGERKSIVEKLRQAYDERRRVVAVTRAGTLMEIFVSSAGTWTVLITAPGGPSCLVSSGEGWQSMAPTGGDA